VNAHENHLDRRRLLTLGAGCLGLGAVAAFGRRGVRALSSRTGVLVRVELRGGNDGLNTLIPFSHPTYRRERPTLALSGDEVLGIERGLGLHPALAPLMPLWTAGRMAIVPSVGCPKPDRSHFQQRRIWVSGDPQLATSDGWLARLVAAEGAHGPDALVCIGDEPHAEFTSSARTPLVLAELSDLQLAASLRDQVSTSALRDAFRPLSDAQSEIARDALELSDRLSSAPRTTDALVGLERDLDTVAQLLIGGCSARAYSVVLDGFDTHVVQRYTHHLLLGEFARSVARFFAHVERSAPDLDVLLVAQSEFGRRVAQNAAEGTDHGFAGPVFAFGSRVRGGIVGPALDLNRVHDGDLLPAVDFRSLLAECARHLDLDPRRVLSGDWAPLQLLA